MNVATVVLSMLAAALVTVALFALPLSLAERLAIGIPAGFALGAAIAWVTRPR